jgi:pentatricopeptide repeat protein
MGGLAKEAAKLERHIRRKGFPATVEMYNGMIEAYSKAALYEEALSVLDGMTEAKIEPNEVRGPSKNEGGSVNIDTGCGVFFFFLLLLI